jgi:hypothetical protein
MNLSRFKLRIITKLSKFIHLNLREKRLKMVKEKEEEIEIKVVLRKE